MSDADMKIDPIKRERAVDAWLEAALHHYGKVEPRAGLEGRVLVSLQVERTRTTAPSRWWWAAGLATALAVIAATVWVWQGGREARRIHTAGTTNARQHEVANTRPPETYSAKKVTQRSKHRPIHNVVVATTPKMEQFPSPQPLSEQEKLLMSYVAGDPEKAALVAQARAETLARDREEEAAWAVKDNTE